MKFDGAEVNILAAVKERQSDYLVEEATGDVLSDAVYECNATVEERFGVKLNYNVLNSYSAGKATVATALQGAVMSGDGSIDIYLANSAYVGGMNSILYAFVYFSNRLYTTSAYALLVSCPLQLVTFVRWQKRPSGSSVAFAEIEYNGTCAHRTRIRTRPVGRIRDSFGGRLEPHAA